MWKILLILRLKLARLRSILVALLTGPEYAHCPICKKKTFFIEEGIYHREKDRCVRCGSIPRWRALFNVLDTTSPDWQKLKIHESSPYGSVSKIFKDKCPQCTQTFYYPEVELGSMKNGYQCENLEKQTFAGESFDLVVTQDVLEHVSDPKAVFQEIKRTLKKGGKHIFTVPRTQQLVSSPRVRFADDQPVYLKEPTYHGNPIDSNGSLVITDWGDDLCDLIQEWTGMKTQVVSYQEESVTPDGESIEVFTSMK